MPVNTAPPACGVSPGLWTMVCTLQNINSEGYGCLSDWAVGGKTSLKHHSGFCMSHFPSQRKTLPPPAFPAAPLHFAVHTTLKPSFQHWTVHHSTHTGFHPYHACRHSGRHPAVLKIEGSHHNVTINTMAANAIAITQEWLCKAFDRLMD